MKKLVRLKKEYNYKLHESGPDKGRKIPYVIHRRIITKNWRLIDINSEEIQVAMNDSNVEIKEPKNRIKVKEDAQDG